MTVVSSGLNSSQVEGTSKTFLPARIPELQRLEKMASPIQAMLIHNLKISKMIRAFHFGKTNGC